MRRKDSYLSGRRRKGRNRIAGPDFGKLYKEKKSNRLAGFFIVLFLSVGLGVGAYVLADYHLDKKENGDVTPTPVVTQAPVVTEAPTPTPEVSVVQGPVYPDGFMADFVDTRVKTDVKGIYVNTTYLGKKNYPTLDELIELIDRTELNAVVVDISRGAFAHGQVYVALSRTRRSADMHVAAPLRPRDVIFDSRVLEFVSND